MCNSNSGLRGGDGLLDNSATDSAHSASLFVRNPEIGEC